MSRTRLIPTVICAAVSLLLTGCMEEISRKESWGAGTSDYRSQYRGGNPLGGNQDVSFERQGHKSNQKEDKGWFDGWFDWFE